MDMRSVRGTQYTRTRGGAGGHTREGVLMRVNAFASHATTNVSGSPPGTSSSHR